MMTIWFTVLFLTSYSFVEVLGYKILVAFPYPGKSHTILGEGYVRHLLNAGHEVTYITPIPIKKPHPNLKQIDVSSNIEKFEFAPLLDFKKILSKEVDLTDMGIMYEAMLRIHNKSITHENVQKFMMESTDQFDLVIAEWLYADLYCGFAAVFNCPYVWSSSIEPHPVILSLIDEISNPAYSPDHMSPISPPLTFTQRVGELWNLVFLFWKRWTLKEAEAQAFKSAFAPAVAKRGLNLPTIEELKYNSSIIFGNSHISSGLAQRVPPNYIHISGYHIEDETPPLPENLKKILDGSPHGVIYFSMGTMVKSQTLPADFKRALLKVFGELKQTVIWKLEEEQSDLPKNVHIVQWAPQQSILAHPNCILFITHGGLLSTTEALHFGKPIIGIPVFADQFINVMRASQKGFAIQVPLGLDTPINLKTAIKEILGNPKYAQKTKELSFIYHHRTLKPGAEMVHWVEHVIQTKGAVHLRTPALKTPLYQKLYLDLLGLILIVVTAVKYGICKLLRPKQLKDTKKKKH